MIRRRVKKRVAGYATALDVTMKVMAVHAAKMETAVPAVLSDMGVGLGAAIA